MRVLVIGASGMIGSTMLRVLAQRQDWTVAGTVRHADTKRTMPASLSARLVAGVPLDEPHTITRVLADQRPDVVVNCAGLTKHKPEADDPNIAIPINAWMPHWLAGLCRLAGARFIHVSSDCVFLGTRGHYLETDATDAADVYGKTKALGEVTAAGALTLRTSTIGHELHTAYGLLDWFLQQDGRCRGFTRAIFSGLPTVEFARVVRDIVIPDATLTGLYNVAAEPINKHDLLTRIAAVYGKSITIEPDASFAIDRSLNGEKFRAATSYVAPAWDTLIQHMYADHLAG